MTTIAQSMIRDLASNFLLGRRPDYNEQRKDGRRFKWCLPITDAQADDFYNGLINILVPRAPIGSIVVTRSKVTISNARRGLAVFVRNDCPLPKALPGDEHYSETVKLALAMQRVASWFHVLMTYKEALAYGRRLGQYNRLHDLGKIIEQINATMPEGCPADYKIGNEYSPVVYVIIRGFDFYKLTKENGKNVSMALDLANKIEQIAKADEFHVENCDASKGLVLRLWWD